MKKQTNVCVDRDKMADRANEFLAKIASMPNEGIAGFEWPEFTHERARISHNNEKYQGMNLAESMFALAGMKVSDKVDMNRFEECKEIHVGDIITLRIKDITKRDVVFDSPFKEDISCSVNLWQYEKLRHFLPKDPIRCKVISKDNHKVIVDPFCVMLDEWLNKKLDERNGNKYPSINQYTLDKDSSVVVKNLHLMRGGYIGTVRIDTISDFVGQDVCVDAFIPGSQIVLNIENDFSRWEGKDVKAFVYNYISRGNNSMSVVCSAKEVLKFDGQKNMISIFSDYTEDNKRWRELQKKKYVGSVTGILRSAKKCGVFVEVDDINVTGMVEVAADELVNYKPQDKLIVSWDKFDEPMAYNHEVGQMQHVDPYVIENNILKKFNVKPIFKIESQINDLM